MSTGYPPYVKWYLLKRKRAREAAQNPPPADNSASTPPA